MQIIGNWCQKQVVNVNVSLDIKTKPSCVIKGRVLYTVELILNPRFPPTEDDDDYLESDQSSGESADEDSDTRHASSRVVSTIRADHFPIHIHAQMIPKEARYCLGVAVYRQTEEAGATAVIGRLYPGQLVFGGKEYHARMRTLSAEMEIHVRARMSAPSTQSKQQNHLFLVGPPGVGKSTAAGLIAKSLFGAQWMKEGGLKPVIRINASNISLSELKSTLQCMRERAHKERYEKYPFCLVIVEEISSSDFARRTHQDLLRRPMETSFDHIRFIFTANYKTCMISALLSRVQTVQFKSIASIESTRTGISRVLQKHSRAIKEPISISEAATVRIHRSARGDMRSVVKYLQAAFSTAYQAWKQMTYRKLKIEEGHVLQWTYDVISNV